jgi:decaprenylphospho-beta-D-ribofuranose 2-oxidase
MSPDRPAEQSERTLLTGWGRTSPTAARYVHLSGDDDVAGTLARAGERGTIPRGLGRSYGDAAQNAGGDVLDLTGVRGIRSLDLDQGIVTAYAGTSLDELMHLLIPMGWFVPVTPGTRFITVGGAIAADIHGKNHHYEGSFSNHVIALTLQTASGERLVVGPEQHADAFWATAGGMGLTGVVIDATFRLTPIETSYVRVDTERVGDLDDLMTRLEAHDDEYRYSVAWIDCLAKGSALGRAILTRSDHATVDELPRRKRSSPLWFHPRVPFKAPPWVPRGLVNPWTIRAFNEMWFRKAPRDQRGAIHSISSFWPLDAVQAWNRLYGSSGFLQYQFVVPFGQEEAMRHAIEQLSRAGAASFLAVLKRFGPGNPAPLSFPAPGWTLALDIPAGDPDLAALLDHLDEVVVEAGGRIYLAKDSRLRPELFGRMYPRLDEWRETRAKLDPDRVFQSDIALATVRKLVERRCRSVVLAGRDVEALEANAKELRARPEAPSVDVARFDANDVASHEGFVDDAFRTHPDLDLVLVAFGVLGEQREAEVRVEKALQIVNTNYVGAVSVMIPVANRLREQGHGTLVVLSSVAGERARRSNFVYGSSKAGLDAFSQGLADSMVGSGATVLVVRPGFVHSKMTDGLKAAPMATTPEAVADAIVGGVASGATTVWVPSTMRWFMSVLRHMPRPVFRRLPI